MKYAYTASLLAFATSCALTNAAAVPKGNKSSTLIVDVHRDWKRLHSEVAKKAKHASKGGAQALDAFDPTDLEYASYWMADITAGGLPAQCLLDTGSADLWLVSPEAPPDATDGVQTWDPSAASDTTKMDGSSFNIGYGQGGNGVSGDVYQTQVCIGSACTQMAVGSATYDQGLGNFPRSGILGLAFQGGNSVSPDKQPTFMEALQPQLDEPIFALKFAPEGGQSQIAFGGNPFQFQEPLQTITAGSSDSDPYPFSWSYSGAEYFKDGQSLGTFDVVFDTGGPMTSAKEDIVRAWYDGIEGARDANGDASTWMVPCGTTLPDLTIQFGESPLVIPGEKFYNGNTNTEGECQVWFVKENSPNRAVIGDPFFTQHVVVFNQQDSTISWGNQV